VRQVLQPSFREWLPDRQSEPQPAWLVSTHEPPAQGTNGSGATQAGATFGVIRLRVNVYALGSSAGRVSRLNGWPRAALGEEPGPPGTCLGRPTAAHHRELAHLGLLAEFVMRTSPPLALHAPGQDTYLVLDDFGQLGRAWRETVENATDRETLMRNLVEASSTTPSASSPSTALKAGAEMQPWISPMNCGDATLNSARFRSRFSSSCRRTGAEIVGPPRALQLERPPPTT